MALGPRLAAVAAYVLPGAPMADIGTDHAYLPVHLVRAGLVPRVVAGDLMPGPLEAARTTVHAAGLQDRIDLRLGSGLTILAPGEAGSVAVCGMGGPLIAQILQEGPLSGVQRLILQPMGGEDRLRGWLEQGGWRLVAERLVEEAGRIYSVLVAEPGLMRLDEADRLVGPILRRTGGPLFAAYAGEMLARSRRALSGARRSRRPEAAGRVAALEHQVALLEEVLRDADGNSGSRGPSA